MSSDSPLPHAHENVEDDSDEDVGTVEQHAHNQDCHCSCALCSRPLPSSSRRLPTSDPYYPKTVEEWMKANDTILNCKCNQPAFRRQSTSPGSSGQWFYTCYKNYKPGHCGFFKWDQLPTPPKTPEMSPERRNRTISASQAAGGGNINGGSAMNTPLRPRTTSVINRDSPIFKSVMRGIEDGNSSDEDTRGFQDEEAEDLFVGGGRGGGVGRRSMPASPTKKASVSQYAPYSARDRPQSKPTSMSQSQVASSSNARTGGLRRTATLPEATFTNDLASHSMHGSTSANGGTTAATTTTSTRHQEFPYTRMPVEKLVTMIQQRDQLLVAKDRQIEAQQLQSRAQLQYTEALQQELNLMRDQLDFYQNEAVEVIVEGPPESPRLLLSPERSPRATYEPLRGLETPIRNIRFEETVSSMIRNGSSNGTTVTVTPAIPVRTTLNMGAMTPAATPGMRTTVGHGGGGGGGKPGAGEGENPQIVTSHFLPGADGRMEPRRTGEMWN